MNTDKDLCEQITIPISVRLPAEQAFWLYLYGAQMNKSPGRLLADILEEILPFESQKALELKVSKMYSYMKEQDFLRSVNEQDLQDKLFKRTVSGGKVGRPQKLRSLNSKPL
jgi:hypothetical protein